MGEGTDVVREQVAIVQFEYWEGSARMARRLVVDIVALE